MEKYRLISGNIDRQKTRLLLDIGCRDKVFQKYIDVPYLGIDLECAKKENPPDIIADFMQVDRYWDQYTTSVVLDVIEHLPDMTKGLEKILQLSDEAFIFVPNLYSFNKRMRVLLGKPHSDKYRLVRNHSRFGYRHQWFFPLDEFDLYIAEFIKSHQEFRLENSWFCYNSKLSHELSKFFKIGGLFSTGKVFRISSFRTPAD